jgi:hypothetical protein
MPNVALLAITALKDSKTDLCPSPEDGSSAESLRVAREEHARAYYILDEAYYILEPIGSNGPEWVALRSTGSHVATSFAVISSMALCRASMPPQQRMRCGSSSVASAFSQLGG